MVDLDWWTPERVEELKRLWAEKHRAKDIARMMGAASRNAVLGKIHRLKLSNSRPYIKPSRPAHRPRPVMTHDHYGTPIPPKKPRPVKPPTVKEIEKIIRGYPTGVLLADRRWDQCAYPINGGNPFLFCGARVNPNKRSLPYCREHYIVMYARR